MTKRVAAASVGAIALAVAGFTAVQQLGSSSSTPQAVEETTVVAKGCNDWPNPMTWGECQAAGTIRFVALLNMQGAVQFCKWKAANPGEWSRLKVYSESNQAPASIITWLGSSIKNELEAYFATGAPTFSILPNTAPNICGKGALLAPPVVAGVTPGQTDATVTIAP